MPLLVRICVGGGHPTNHAKLSIYTYTPRPQGRILPSTATLGALSSAGNVSSGMSENGAEHMYRNTAVFVLSVQNDLRRNHVGMERSSGLATHCLEIQSHASISPNNEVFHLCRATFWKLGPKPTVPDEMKLQATLLFFVLRTKTYQRLTHRFGFNA